MKPERRDAIRLYTEQGRMTRLNNWQRKAGGCVNTVIVICAVVAGVVMATAAIINLID